MKPCELVLERLEDVRPTGPDRWMARCPSHHDKRPSLSIREGDDGRFLLYCFAGCGAYRVLDALGLDMADLYPKPLESTPHTTRGRRRVAPPIPASDALELLEEQALVIQICAHRLAQGEPVEQHSEALSKAACRISAIREAWISQPKTAAVWSQ